MSALSELTSALRRLWRRRLRTDDRFWMVLFSLAVVLIALAHIWIPMIAVPSLLIAVLLAASFVMGSHALLYLEIVIGFAIVLMALQGNVIYGQFIGVVVSGLLVMWWVRFRAKHGLPGTQTDTMLLEVRDRIVKLATVPKLPNEWNVDVQIRPAHGASFSGDFAIFAEPDPFSIEFALIDVSGKGTQAAARALLLQSAFGGLIGSMPFGDFLPSANNFLLRQHWDEGFATAAHVRINLGSGRFLLSLAGHPPAASFSAGSGKWLMTGGAGDVLGVSSESRFPVESGDLNPGDALLIYTDGLIEVPGRDLLFGIDKLLGGAEQLVARSWRSGARWLLDSLDLGDGDDCAVILVRRLPGFQLR